MITIGGCVNRRLRRCRCVRHSSSWWWASRRASRTACAAAKPFCQRRRGAAARDRDPGGHLHRAGDLLTGAAARARHRRQRLALSRPDGGLALAAVEPAGPGEKICEAGRRRDPAFTTAKMFWWYNMGRERTISASRRGRSTSRTAASCRTPTAGRWNCATNSRASSALFRCSSFWGPATIAASRWIADAALHVRRALARP